MPMLPKDCRDHGPDIATAARIFATRDAKDAEAAIAKLIAEALDRWLLDDATYWQRVRYRARHLRTQGRSHAPVGEPRFC